MTVLGGFQKPAPGGDWIGGYAVTLKKCIAQVKLRDGILQFGSLLEKPDRGVRTFCGALAQLMAASQHAVGFNGAGKGSSLEMFKGAFEIRLISEAVIVIQAYVEVVVRLGFIGGRRSGKCA